MTLAGRVPAERSRTQRGRLSQRTAQVIRSTTASARQRFTATPTVPTTRGGRGAPQDRSCKPCRDHDTSDTKSTMPDIRTIPMRATVASAAAQSSEITRNDTPLLAAMNPKLGGNLMVTSRRARSKHRRVLAELDDHLLEDIGLTRADVEQELKKPLWRPSHGSPSTSATSARAASRISCRLRAW